MDTQSALLDQCSFAQEQQGALGTFKDMPCIISQAFILPMLPLTPLQHFKV